MTHQHPNSASSTPLDASVFRRLSLLMHECRTEKIRSAIRKQAGLVHRSASRWKANRVDKQLGLLVTSGYRLLDPRFRTSDFERIQLAYPLERLEEEIPVLPPLSLLTPPQQLTPVSEMAPENSFELVELVDQAVGQLATSESQALPVSTVLPVSPVDEDSLEVRRELVRLIRQEERNEQDGWLGALGKWWVGGSSGLILIFACLGLSRSYSSQTPVPPMDVIQSTLFEEANAGVPIDLASQHLRSQPTAS